MRLSNIPCWGFFSQISTLLAALTCLLVLPAAHGAGELDASFGDDGLSLLRTLPRDEWTETAKKATRLPDGKVLIYGSSSKGLFLARFLPTGELDISYGYYGSFLIPVTNLWVSEGMDLQPDGKVVISGVIYSGEKDIMLARILEDGGMDPTFGTNGVVQEVLTPRSHHTTLKVLPDGKILTGGNFEGGVWLARFTSDGQFDTTFGRGGRVAVSRNTQNNHSGQLGRIIVQPDGRILLFSVTILDRYNEQQTITRFHADGSLDLQFGNGGSVGFDYAGTNTNIGPSALLPNGDIVIAVPRVSQNDDRLLAIYTSSGSFRSYYGVFTPLTWGTYSVAALQVTGDGRLMGLLKDRVVEFSANGLQSIVGLSPVTWLERLNADGADGYFLLQRQSGNFRVTAVGADNTVQRTFIAGLTSTHPPTGNVTAVTALDDGNLWAVLQPALTAAVGPYSQGVMLTDRGLNPRASPLAEMKTFLATSYGLWTPDFIGWLNPWPVPYRQQKYHFQKTTSMCANDAREIFVGGKDHLNGVVRKFGRTVISQTLKWANRLPSEVQLLAPVGDGVMVLLQPDSVTPPALVRLSSSLAPVKTFGKNGWVFLDYHTHTLGVQSMACGSDGSVFLARPGEAAGYPWQVVRYTPQGRLDPSFSSDGRAVTPFVSQQDGVVRHIRLLVLADGKVLVAGALPGGFGIARFDRSGNLDPAFGENGLTRLSSGFDLADAVSTLSVHPETGDLLIGGATMTSADGKTFDGFVARVKGDDVVAALVMPNQRVKLNTKLRRWEQDVQVTNHGENPVHNLVLHLGGLPAGVRVLNATQDASTGTWALPLEISLLPGQSQVIKVAYPFIAKIPAPTAGNSLWPRPVSKPALIPFPAFLYPQLEVTLPLR